MSTIIVMDDVFRVPLNGLDAHPTNALMLLAHVHNALRALDTSEHTVTYLGGTQAADRTLNVAALMAALGAAPGVDGWCQLHGAEADDRFTNALEREIGPVDLVIGWELPNCVFEALSARGVAVVDFAVSPLRFGPDLFFDTRCSQAALKDVCDAHVVSAAPLIAAAGVLRAHSYQAHASAARLADLGRVGVVAGQLHVDTALVTRSGGVFELKDGAETVADWARGLDTILYQRHPVASGPDHLPFLTSLGPAVYESNWSTYALCVSRPVEAVLAISSGILDEAPWFECAPTRLHTPLRRGVPGHASLRVAGSVLSPGVLARFLAQVSEVPVPEGLDGPGPVLRDVFGSWATRERPQELVLRQPHKEPSPPKPSARIRFRGALRKLRGKTPG